MDDKRRLFIVIVSVFMGTILSAGLFMMRRGGSLASTDYTSLITNLVFALAIVICIGFMLRNRKGTKK